MGGVSCEGFGCFREGIGHELGDQQLSDISIDVQFPLQDH